MTIEKLAALYQNILANTNEAGLLTWLQKEAEDKFFREFLAYGKEHPELSIDDIMGAIDRVVVAH